jgi:hypothetical protein
MRHCGNSDGWGWRNCRGRPIPRPCGRFSDCWRWSTAVRTFGRILIEFTDGEVLELERAAFGASDTEGA